MGVIAEVLKEAGTLSVVGEEWLMPETSGSRDRLRPMQKIRGFRGRQGLRTENEGDGR